MVATTPEDVIKVLQMTVNFMEITLLGESLSPSADMERQETVERLNVMIERLGNIKDVGFKQSPVATLPKNASGSKFKKPEKKVEKPIRQISTTSIGSSYVDMNDGGKNSPRIEGKELAENSLEERDSDEDYEFPISAVEGASSTTPDRELFSYDELAKKVKSLEKCSPAELKVTATYCGYLTKHKKRVLTKWLRRYCVLKDEFLFYFKSETDNKETGIIILPGYFLTIPPKDKGYLFILESRDKTRDNYMFQAEYQEEFEQWKKHILSITSKVLSTTQMGNQLAGEKQANDSNESSGGAQVADICGEIYDDVAAESAPAQEIYDDVAAVNEPEQEIYDDVADAPPSFPPPPPELIAEEPAEPEGEMYELIPGQMNQNAPPVVPAPLPARTPLKSPTVETPLVIPPRPSSQNTPPPRIPVEIPSPFPSPIVRSPSSRDKFSMDNIYIGLYDCTGDDKEDLTFNRGDILYKLEELDMNWWLGYLNGNVGLVPSNFFVEAFE